MKQYTCIKTVKATPMNRLEAQGILGRLFYSNEGYLVEYEDGYKLWSPKEVFEHGYTLTESHIDCMKFELSELTKRIAKAVEFAYKPESVGNVHSLKEQIDAMLKYAHILQMRIHEALFKEYKEREANAPHIQSA